MKVCFKCNVQKPLCDFYKHPEMADGHLGKCKICAKKDIYIQRHESPSREKILAYDRNRGNRQTLKYRQDYKIKYPNKYKAHGIVARAIRSKKLFSEPCEVCGKENTHGHHDDYNKPLNVRWLCAEHHQQWHAENGCGLNSF